MPVQFSTCGSPVLNLWQLISGPQGLRVSTQARRGSTRRDASADTSGGAASGIGDAGGDVYAGVGACVASGRKLPSRRGGCGLDGRTGRRRVTTTGTDAVSTDARRQGVTPALIPPEARLAASTTAAATSPPALALASRPDENCLCAAADVALTDAGTTAALPRASPRVPQRRGGRDPAAVQRPDMKFRAVCRRPEAARHPDVRLSPADPDPAAVRLPDAQLLLGDQHPAAVRRPKTRLPPAELYQHLGQRARGQRDHSRQINK